MTEEQTFAERERFEGYLYGFDLSSPEPSANRSASYRHGFINGRADKTGKLHWPSIEVARLYADRAEAEDAAA